MIVSADKGPVLYKIPVPVYKKMLRNAVTETYQKSSQNKVSKVNQETLDLVKISEPGLESRVEVFTQAPAFFTVKDHKMGFPSKVDVRVINPAKPQFGKITKVKLHLLRAGS